MSVIVSKKRYLLMVVISVIIFSTFEVVTKTMSGTLSGTTLTFYRFLIGGLVLLPFSIRDLKKRNFKFSLKIIGLLFLFGAMLVAVIMTLAQYGIFYSDASICAVIFSANPIFVTIFAVILLKETFTKNKLIGLFLGAFGLFISCTHVIFNTEYSSTFSLGVTLQIVSMLLFCVYTVLSKKVLVSKMGALSVTTFTSLFGAIVLFPVIIIQSSFAQTNLFVFDIGSVLWQFLYAAAIGTGLAYAMYFSGLAQIETGTGSMIFMAKPPLAAIFAATFLGESITIDVIIGIILIITAMTIVIKPPSPVPKNNEVFENISNNH